MELKEYFEKIKGIGILSTADAVGNVNAALYSCPHFMENKQIAFIMNERLSHTNLQSNPRAVFLFIENGSVSRGKRLYLKKVKEETDTDLIKGLKKRHKESEGEKYRERKLYLVYFTIENIRELID